MPIYEYRCLNCEAQFEKLQKSSDEAITVCETCGGELQKQWSLSGFQFKGAGWYVTDYAKKKEKGKGKKGETQSTEKTESASKDKNSEPPKKSKDTKEKD